MYLKRRKRNPRRNPLSLLQQPRSHKDSSGQNFSHRFLLANSFERCRRTSQTVQRVPNVLEASSCISSWTNLYPSCLTVRMLGVRPSRTTQKGQGWIWVHLRCNRQIHQVDRVQAARKIQRGKSSQVHPRHYAPLQNTQPRHHRFGFPFYSYWVQKLGTRLRHQYRLCISYTPWRQ
jgi:hypothetical protein